MLELPKPKRLSLAAARSYIGEHVGKSGQSREVGETLHRALCENSLSAEGQFQSSPNSKNISTKTIPHDIWNTRSYSDFLSSNECIQVDTKGKYRKYSPRYHNPTIATADIDAWLAKSTGEKKGDNKQSNPITPNNWNKTYITAVEAVIWIAYKKQLNYDQLLSGQYKQEDIFWGSPFFYMYLWCRKNRTETIVIRYWKAQNVDFRPTPCSE